MEKLVFQHKDNQANLIWKDFLKEDSLKNLLKVGIAFDDIMSSDISRVVLYEEKFDEFDKVLYTFEIALAIHGKKLNIGKIEYLDENQYKFNQWLEIQSELRVNGKRESAFKVDGGLLIGNYIEKIYFDEADNDIIRELTDIIYTGFNKVMFYYLKEHDIRFLSGMTSLSSQNNDIEI